jgi:hypothetical protein
MPSFNGHTWPFGVWCQFLAKPRPARVQFFAFPGVNGRGAIRHGTDGGQTIVQALLKGVDLAALTLIETDLLNLAANGPTVVASLVDDQGRTWQQVYLAQIEPTEDIQGEADGVSRIWQLTFEHLI